jgi:hypothetical protein
MSGKAWMVLGCAALAGLAACEPEEPPPAPKVAAPPKAEAAWRERMLRIAKSFPALGRVDDGGRMSPADCRMPDRAAARFSASDDAATHGGSKVYSIFARDPVPYRKLTDLFVMSHPRDDPMDVDGTEGCTQVLVKEAYEPVEVDAKAAQRMRFGFGDPDDPKEEKEKLQPIRPAAKDGKHFAAGKRVGLFVMFRLDPKTEGTDDGWVYGTVTADATKVTSVGRVESCMRCHVQAPHGRLFGLPR